MCTQFREYQREEWRPSEQSLQSQEDHEIPKDQPDIRQTNSVANSASDKYRLISQNWKESLAESV